MMAVYSATDYSPLVPGTTSNFSGTYNGAASTDSYSLAPGLVNGVPVRKLSDQSVDLDGLSTSTSNYITASNGDIQNIRETTTNGEFNFTDPFLDLPGTFSVGQVASQQGRRLTVVNTSDNSVPPFVGTYNETLTVGLTESLQFNGLYFAAAIKVTSVLDLNLNARGNDVTATVQGHDVNTRWFVRGIGIVQESDVDDLNSSTSNGDVNRQHDDSTSYLVSSSLLPAIATDNGYVLAVNGTGTDNSIAVTSTRSGLLAVVDGIGRDYPSAGLLAIGVTGGAGNDAITIGPGVPNASIVGGHGDDTIVGGDGTVTLVGGQGNDRIFGKGGNDLARERRVNQAISCDTTLKRSTNRRANQPPLNRLYLCGLGTRGSVGVIGISFGGVLGGRNAACFSNASATKSLATSAGWAVVVACLNSRALMIKLLMDR